MAETHRAERALTGLFGAFMFLQLAVLGLGNRAGEGYLTTAQREWVYYALQVFVILGFLLGAVLNRPACGARVRRIGAYALPGGFLAGTAVMLAADRGSLFYLLVTFLVMLCLGSLGETVYARMSRATAAGAATARSMGLGCAAAVGLQYLLQIQWGVTPLLPVFLLAAFALLAFLLSRAPREGAEADGNTPPARTPLRRLVFACLITTAFILFTSFYNGYIQHLQIQSAYADYNVYSWPRLMLIPCYLLFAAIGDRREGRLVPVVALCIMLCSLLNPVLSGSDGAYRVNMCLFYCAISASVTYYNLSFWRLAPGTKRPFFWASAGRVLDSVLVLATGTLRLSALPSATVLALNIVLLAATIILMAVGGDFELSARSGAAAEAPVPAGNALERMQARYALTTRETEVLRELVLTEDKQTAIAERLSIRPRTVQSYVTALYQKTGASTRSGLTDLYRDAAAGK